LIVNSTFSGNRFGILCNDKEIYFLYDGLVVSNKCQINTVRGLCEAFQTIYKGYYEHYVMDKRLEMMWLEMKGMLTRVEVIKYHNFLDKKAKEEKENELKKMKLKVKKRTDNILRNVIFEKKTLKKVGKEDIDPTNKIS